MANGNNGNGAPKPVRCAIYTRKSTDEGLNQDFNSLDAQRDAGEAYIRSQAGEGWTLVPDQYDDGGYTVTGSGNTSVTWSVSPSVGSINSNGLYTAPAVIGTAQSVTVRATSQADPSKSATATVTFYSPGTSGYFPVFGSFLNFYRNMPQELWAKEFDMMREVDMDTIIVVSVGRLRSSASDPLGYSLSPEGLLYPSTWVPPAERPTTDRLEMIL